MDYLARKKEKLRTIEWNWIGEKDVITDVGSIIPENILSFWLKLKIELIVEEPRAEEKYGLLKNLGFILIIL